ncbi:MAG: cytochrome-c peroxidase [Cytophagales bacterium]|nr:cytochrome-c peroxidase [Cytophagales bacterium]
MNKLSSLLLILSLYSCSEDNSKVEIIQILEENLSEITLASTCPPGFELNENNECINRNLYQQYQSLENVGVGGLKTALPKVRDGFSPQQIDLGRYLFFDPVLSADSSISCASCHQPNKGFSDGLSYSVGVMGRKTGRSAPSLWNVAFMNKFFWDGHSKNLEEQMQGPLFSKNEMGTNPELLLKILNSIPNYQNLFSTAFPLKTSDTISLTEIYTALTAFECSLISLNSRYDQYAHGYHEALTKNEIEGMNVFRSFVARCAECHTPPLFSNQQIAVIGTPDPEGMPFDNGAEISTKDSTLRGGFKIPSLRNIDLTAPYGHSGVFSTLKESIEFYTKGRGHAVPKDSNLILHWHIWEPNLSEDEIERIADFLKTLTDESFKPAEPKKLPSGINLKKTPHEKSI